MRILEGCLADRVGRALRLSVHEFMCRWEVRAHCEEVLLVVCLHVSRLQCVRERHLMLRSIGSGSGSVAIARAQCQGFAFSVRCCDTAAWKAAFAHMSFKICARGLVDMLFLL